MLTVTISVLFGLAAVAASLVIAASVTGGYVRARQILLELAEMEKQVARRPLRAPAIRVPSRVRPSPALRQQLAAA